MCLALVALNAHPRYRLLIAANRDEFHARPAAPASWWPDRTLAGRDTLGGGTWFGIRPGGRWALVTNYREGVPRDPNAPSRGALVTRMLDAIDSPLVGGASIACDGDRYHGFNLIAGCAANSATAAYVSNRASGAIALDRGLYGVSNHLLDTPWPKLVRCKEKLARLLKLDDIDVSALFDLLADRHRVDDRALPSTGVSARWERLLSSPFILDPEYGTRCSTVLCVDTKGAARFIERSFDAAGDMTGEVVNEFAVAQPRECRAGNGIVTTSRNGRT